MAKKTYIGILKTPEGGVEVVLVQAKSLTVAKGILGDDALACVPQGAIRTVKPKGPAPNAVSKYAPPPDYIPEGEHATIGDVELVDMRPLEFSPENRRRGITAAQFYKIHKGILAFNGNGCHVLMKYRNEPCIDFKRCNGKPYFIQYNRGLTYIKQGYDYIMQAMLDAMVPEECEARRARHAAKKTTSAAELLETVVE